jgi:hypothetical protein
VDFLSVYDRLSRRGEAETDALTLDTDDSDADIVIDDDLFSDLAREHQHSFLPLTMNPLASKKMRVLNGER